MIFSSFLTESEWNAKHQPLPHLCLHGMLFSPRAWRPDECGARYLVCHAITQPGGGLCGNVWRRKLSDSIQQSSLQNNNGLEQAAIMEIEKFVKATYTLEGDETLVFIDFQQLEELKQFIHVQNFATLTRVVQQFSPFNFVEQQRWYFYMVWENVWCLLSNTTWKHLPMMLSSPVPSEYFKQLSCSTNEMSRHRGQLRLQILIGGIRAVPFLNDDNTIQSALKDDLPAYLVMVGNIPDDFDALAVTWQWWRNNVTEIPSWASAAKKSALVGLLWVLKSP